MWDFHTKVSTWTINNKSITWFQQNYVDLKYDNLFLPNLMTK